MEEDYTINVVDEAGRYLDNVLTLAREQYRRSGYDFNTYGDGYLDAIEEHVENAYIAGALFVRNEVMALLEQTVEGMFPKDWTVIKEAVKQTLASKMPKVFLEEDNINPKN